MAFIYRYQLKNSKLREKTLLSNYEHEIKDVLEKLFAENLKDIIVENQYFEFKLYVTVNWVLLQDMGRMLKAKLPIGINKHGFVRMEQTLYALVYKPQEVSTECFEKNQVHVELIDSTVIDSHDKFKKRAISFFEKSGMEPLSKNTNTYIDNGIVQNFYIDILDAYTNDRFPPTSTNNTSEITCFALTGFHRRIEKGEIYNNDESRNFLLKLEKCFDIGFIENRDRINDIKGVGTSHSDYLEIKTLKECSKLVNEIEKKLSLQVLTATTIEGLDSLKKDETYVFRTHNIGQANACSLSKKNGSPFLYFDYGMPYGENSSTRPSNVDMATNKGITIIISHVDKDHWFRVADEANSYKCHWYIPDQLRKTQLNHKLAEIIASGGTVHKINSDIKFKYGKITCSGQSKLKSSKKAKDVHQTGLTLRINAKDESRKKMSILMAGDQQYDYVENSQLCGLDILVASHHGGSFCWNENNGVVPTAKKSGKKIVIYSCGHNNSYNHPSMCGFYIKQGWVNELLTSNGEYKIAIVL